MQMIKIPIGEQGSGVSLTAYLSDSPDKPLCDPRPAVLILPGGAYLFVSEREGEPVALAFAASGYQAFVLHYSVGTRARMPLPVLEGFLALLRIRDNAAAWRVDPARVAICGFSAGGHLAGCMLTRWNDPLLITSLGRKPEELRPDAGILCYALLKLPTRIQPSPTGVGAQERDTLIENVEHEQPSLPKSWKNALIERDGMLWVDYAAIVALCMFGQMQPSADALSENSPVELVQSDTPPVFLWATTTDGIVPASDSIAFAEAMYDNGRPVELHVFGAGQHGLSLARYTTGDTDEHDPVARWFDMALDWLPRAFVSPESPPQEFFLQSDTDGGGEGKSSIKQARERADLRPAPELYYDSIYQNRTSMFRHTSFALEQQLVKAVIKGDEPEAMRLMGQIESMGDKAVLASDPLRSAKNSIICSCTLLSRASIQAGVPPEEAFALSDVSIRHIEQLHQRGEVLQFEKELLLQFIHLVQQKQNREYTTPIRRALHYIDTHLDARVTLNEVAQYAGVHPNYLSRRFRQETGKTVGSYTNERKVMESVYFVQRQGYAMADIASLYAFSSQSYFISNFKKIMGLPPGEYRAMMAMVE